MLLVGVINVEIQIEVTVEGELGWLYSHRSGVIQIVAFAYIEHIQARKEVIQYLEISEERYSYTGQVPRRFIYLIECCIGIVLPFEVEAEDILHIAVDTRHKLKVAHIVVEGSK